MLSAGSAVVQSTAVDWNNHPTQFSSLPPVCKITTILAQHPRDICKARCEANTAGMNPNPKQRCTPFPEENSGASLRVQQRGIYLAQRSQRPQLAGAAGDITSPGRPRDPRPLLPRLLASARSSSPVSRRSGHSELSVQCGAKGPAGGRSVGAAKERGGSSGPCERRAPDEASDVPTNLYERRSYEDGRALDSVLLPQLLPVLPCPHRHHPAGRLVPGERRPASREPPGSPRAPLTPRR